MSKSPYIIGIDLGTTNTVVAYIRREDFANGEQPRIFPILQVTSPGELQELNLLPSFIYLPEPQEIAQGSLDLPWAQNRDFCVGNYAQFCASQIPHRVVSSAKSWLCTRTIDKRTPTLPVTSQTNKGRQISPVQAIQLILEHVRDAWNYAHPDSVEHLENQDIILTVPASFDAIARELTVEASSAAGLSVILLEEPQAAFYAWLNTYPQDWRKLVSVGERILVCDIGGGTSDFTLIEVINENGNVGLRRIAVGNHLLLGGDNMDLTLSYSIGKKIEKEIQRSLGTWEIVALTHACRRAKEELLGENPPSTYPITILGQGSSVIGGSLTIPIQAEEAQKIILDGFFPFCKVTDRPLETSGSGLRSFGLQYARDVAITRHLASFLLKNEGDLPTSILFNGGVSRSPLIRQRIIEVMNSWIEGGSLQILPNPQPDLAVALGAVWYGLVRDGKAIRIRAGSPRNYYIGVESALPAIPGMPIPMDALCIVPYGMEEGSEYEVPFEGLGLEVGVLTQFAFFSSVDRRNDQVGDLITNLQELEKLPPLETILPIDEGKYPSGSLVPIRLKVILTEIGTLQLWCQSITGNERWKLEYQVRGESSETN